MKIITYKFADGTSSNVEVTDEFYAVYNEMEITDKRSNRRETRRHVSIEVLVELGIEPITPDNGIYIALFDSFHNEKLREGIAQLLPSQQDLLQRIYFERQTVTEIAKEFGIEVCSISKRLERIYKRLKNFLADRQL